MRMLLALATLFAPLAAQEYYITLDPNTRVEISARVSSPVKTIHKKLGDSFEKGDLLIELESEVFDANFHKAEAAYAKSKTKLDIKKELFAEDSASLYEIKDAEAELAHANAEKVMAKLNLKETAITAPFSGKVSRVYVQEHELSKPGEPLLEIIDDKTLKARFFTSSKTPLSIDDDIHIDLSETGETLSATITRLSPDIDPSSGTIKVQANIDNSDGKYKAGMSGKVRTNGLPL